MNSQGFRSVLSVALVIYLLSVVTSPVFADVEPNNTRQDAELIAAGTHVGELPGDDEADYYAFTVHGGNVVTVEAVEAEADPDLQIGLQSGDGAGLASLTAEGEPRVVVVTPVELGERTWHLEVTGEGAYRFALDLMPQDDAGQGQDAPADRDNALTIAPGEVEGLLGDDDEYDAYAFPVQGGDIIHVVMADVAGGESVELRLRDHEGSGLAGLRPEGQNEVTYLTPSEHGERTWYLIAYDEGPYHFALHVIPQDDAGQGVDAPEPRHRALEVQPGQIRGSVGDDDEWDCYRFDVAPGQTVEVTLTADFTRFDREMNWVEATVRDAEGSNMGGLRSAGAANPDTFREGPLEIEQPEQWTVTVGTEGDYVIDLRIVSAEGTELERLEQVSVIDWETFTPVDQQPEFQAEPEEDTGPTAEGSATQDMEPQPETGTEQPVDVEEHEQVPADEMVPIEGPVYARVLVDSVYCVSESQWDRGTDSDEPYFIITGYAADREPAAWSSGTPYVFSDVDDRENRRFPDHQRVVFEGELTDGAVIGFTVLAMESDDWPPSTRRRIAEYYAEQTAAAVTGAVDAALADRPDADTMWEMGADWTDDIVLEIMTLPLTLFLNVMDWALGGEDDRIADATVGYHHDDLAAWAGQGVARDMPTVVLDGGDEGHYGIRWHIEFEPDITRTFDARFTHWDDIAVGNVIGDSRDEIITACDDDASGNNGLFRIYDGDGLLLNSFEAFFNHYDRIAVGDVWGTGHEQIVVASDDHGGMINIYTFSGQQLYSFPAVFDHFDGLAVGDVVGDDQPEILVADRSDDAIRVYDAHGEGLLAFRIAWDFRGTRYTDDTTRHDAFLVGDVLGDEKDEIVMIDCAGGVGSEVYIYNAERPDSPVGDNAGVAGGFAIGWDAVPQPPIATGDLFFSELDAAALGDRDGDGKCELLLAADQGTGGPGCFINVHELPACIKCDIRPWPILTRHDGFASGDVLGVGSDQLIIATNDDNRIYVTR